MKTAGGRCHFRGGIPASHIEGNASRMVLAAMCVHQVKTVCLFVRTIVCTSINIQSIIIACTAALLSTTDLCFSLNEGFQG